MKVPVCALNFASLVRPPRLLPALFAGMLLCSTHSAVAALSFGRGTPTTVGCVRYANSPDSVTLTAALTAPGTITGGLAIPANRIQYDIINCDTGPLLSWTIFYGAAPGTCCITTTCANITVATCAPCTNVVYNATATDKCCDPASVNLIYNPPVNFCFPTGVTTPVQVIAIDQCGNTATNYFTVTVNPRTDCGPPNGCIKITAPNVVAYHCNPCTPVTYNISVTDQCCPASGVTWTV